MANPAACVVLVVEDEAIPRWLAVDVVESAGFSAIAAQCGGDAIKILEGRKDVCVVFTDVGMPGAMGGIELAKAIRRRWPAIELIVTSGTKIRRENLPKGARFFAKPYKLADVVAATQKMAAV